MPVWMPGAGGCEEQRLGGSMWEEAEGQVRQHLVGLVRMTASILSGGGGGTGSGRNPPCPRKSAPWRQGSEYTLGSKGETQESGTP